MGPGDDTFVWAQGDGSDLVEGDAGQDTMFFNGSSVNENFDLAANGSRLKFFRDFGNITMDVNAVETVVVAPGGGADNVVVNDLTGTGVAQVDVDMGSDAAADTVSVNANASANNLTVSDDNNGFQVTGLSAKVVIFNADAASDSLQLNTLGGADSIAVNQTGIGSVRRIVIDAGIQQDTINVTSTAAASVVSVLPSSGDDTINVNADAVGAANVLFGATQRIGALTIGGGGVVALTPGGVNVLTLTSLNIAGSGQLNLNDDAMILDYTGNTRIATIQSLLGAGYHGGAWNGSGIMTSLGNASRFALGYAETSDVAATGTFAGQPVDGTAVVVRFTIYGDADLNGTVNVADLGRLATNFGDPPRRWAEGNFNYDGGVDVADLGSLATNFGLGVNNTLVSLSTASVKRHRVHG
jgi:hypothetical protein